MKAELNRLIESLTEEYDKLEKERARLARQDVTLKKTRKDTATECITALLPNLEHASLKRLAEMVPDFHVPTVKKWFGLAKTIDPSVTLESLRIKLAAYLNANPNNCLLKAWNQDVLPKDKLIRELHEKLIPANVASIQDIGAKITRLNRLVASADHMTPEIGEKITQAAKMITGSRREEKKKTSRRKTESSKPPQYPNANQINSDSGPDLLEAWLWWQLFTPSSGVSKEIAQFESGGGEFGGAGASGSWESNLDTVPGAEKPASDQYPAEVLPSSDAPSDGADLKVEAELSEQAGLGSESFS